MVEINIYRYKIFQTLLTAYSQHLTNTSLATHDETRLLQSFESRSDAVVRSSTETNKNHVGNLLNYTYDEGLIENVRFMMSIKCNIAQNKIFFCLSIDNLWFIRSETPKKEIQSISASLQRILA